MSWDIEKAERARRKMKQKCMELHNKIAFGEIDSFDLASELLAMSKDEEFTREGRQALKEASDDILHRLYKRKGIEIADEYDSYPESVSIGVRCGYPGCRHMGRRDLVGSEYKCVFHQEFKGY